LEDQLLTAGIENRYPAKSKFMRDPFRPPSIGTPQISVLDAGGQYCHLIARKVREHGIFAEVLPSETPAAELKSRKGVIISGGPSSVYEEGSPTVDPGIFALGTAVLGICYGQQLMALNLGGQVEKGELGEYGLARLLTDAESPLLDGTPSRQQVWMSHRDVVGALPAGFRRLAHTDTCEFAAVGDTARRLYGVQFHPEVVHTENGMRILENFLFKICGCTPDWDPKHQIPAVEQHIRDVAGDRNVFFFVSGGVDSTVAYTLCLHALGKDRVRGLYVDTGLMREGETGFVHDIFREIGKDVAVEDARDRFLGALAGVIEPEHKRRIIGQQFVEVQERMLESGPYLDGSWILGQGTIYPDTIESGGTSKAEVIKTHHNRVPGIQRLIDQNRIVEPLSMLYKDEVRAIGAELGIPDELLHRHPFPGPGLAIRCLCAASTLPLERVPGGYIVPVRSVGVQGDSRSYRPVLAMNESPLSHDDLHERATELINRTQGINRVIARVASHAALGEMMVRPGTLDHERVERLRGADAVVRRQSHESGFDAKVWQFPVVLIPLGTAEAPDSVVLRPIHSVDGMTAQSVEMEHRLLEEMADELLKLPGVCGVFYDLTHKPPATIEWE
jgi:GMP synthase (glutamine-hydrolysing)